MRSASNMYEHIWQSSVMCCMCEQADVDSILMWFSGWCPEFMCERGSADLTFGLLISKKTFIWHFMDKEWFQKIISEQHWLLVVLVILWPQQCNSTPSASLPVGLLWWEAGLCLLVLPRPGTVARSTDQTYRHRHTHRRTKAMNTSLFIHKHHFIHEPMSCVSSTAHTIADY